jgi:hypothetical protein
MADVPARGAGARGVRIHATPQVGVFHRVTSYKGGGRDGDAPDKSKDEHEPTDETPLLLRCEHLEQWAYSLRFPIPVFDRYFRSNAS